MRAYRKPNRGDSETSWHCTKMKARKTYQLSISLTPRVISHLLAKRHRKIAWRKLLTPKAVTASNCCGEEERFPISSKHAIAEERERLGASEAASTKIQQCGLSKSGAMSHLLATKEEREIASHRQRIIGRTRPKKA